MSNTATTRMIAAYEQSASPTAFFTRMFSSPAANYHNSAEIGIDIERSDEDIAIAITDLTVGSRMNSLDLYTNKKFVPPIYDEAFVIAGTDMIKSVAGSNPFEDFSFLSNATTKFFKGMRKVEAKIRRAIEVQAAQVLQTGTVTLIDSTGATVYAIDYKPKATHFPTVSTAWDGVNPTIEADLANICDVVRDDGQLDPDLSIWGDDVLRIALADTAFSAKFDPRRADTGRIVPLELRDSGGQFRGVIDVGNYQLEVWTYGGRYKHPQTGAMTKLMDRKKVLVRASGGRLDATFGAIPMIVPPESRVLPFLPPRISREGGSMDLTTNVWVDDAGKNLFGSVGTRPLLIPTAIDTFGCLDSDIT